MGRWVVEPRGFTEEVTIEWELETEAGFADWGVNGRKGTAGRFSVVTVKELTRPMC